MQFQTKSNSVKSKSSSRSLVDHLVQLHSSRIRSNWSPTRLHLVGLQFHLIRLEPKSVKSMSGCWWTSHRVYIWYVLTHQGHKSKVGQPFCQSESENTHGFCILSLKNKPISSNWTETNPPLSTQHSSFTWCTWHRPDHFFKVWW